MLLTLICIVSMMCWLDMAVVGDLEMYETLFKERSRRQASGTYIPYNCGLNGGISTSGSIVHMDAFGPNWPADHFCQIKWKDATSYNNDYTFSLSFKCTQNDVCHPGLMFNWQDSKNYDFFYVRTHSPNSCFVHGSVVNGVLAPIIDTHLQCGSPIANGRWSQLKVVLKSGLAQAYVDDEITGSAWAYHFTGGSVGAAACNGYRDKIDYTSFDIDGPFKDPCEVYINVTNSGSTTANCTKDEIKQDIWYRFAETLREDCDQSVACENVDNWFLNGKHPVNKSAEAINSTICLNDGKNCCSHTQPVEIKTCSEVSAGAEYFIYKLNKLSDCPVSYCLGSEPSCSSAVQVIGNCTNDYPHMTSNPLLAGPFAPADMLHGTFEFHCHISYPKVNIDDGARFEVWWYFDNIHDSRITEIINSTSNPTGILNERHFRGHAGKHVSCAVVAYWSGSSKRSPVFKSKDSYWVGIKATIPNNQITGTDQEAAIQLKSTVPVTGHGCEMFVEHNRPEFCKFQFGINSNPFGNKKENQLLQCYAIFHPGNDTAYISISMAPQGGNVKISFQHAEIYFYQYLFTSTMANSIWNSYTIQPIAVTLVNHVGMGICSSVTDPHYTSFDGTYFHIYEPGNFLMVKSTSSRIFEVHSHLRKCQLNSNVACNCGVAVREGNVIIGVDNCKALRSGFRTFKKVLSSTAAAGGTLTSNAAGTEMKITMSSGATVVATNDNSWHLNVRIYLPSQYFGKTEGLCGIWDNNRNNDLKIRNEQEYDTLWPYRRPRIFTESYRLPLYESFFDGSPECKDTQIKQTNFCTCNNSTDLTESQKISCTVETDDYFDAKVDDVCSSQVNIGRKKKQISQLNAFLNSFANLQPTQNYTILGNLSWPSASGITQQQAAEKCMSVMKNSSIYLDCTQIDNFDTDTILDKCKEDILIADDLDVAIAMLSVFQTSCTDAARQNVVIGSSNETTASEILYNLIKNVCINECSGKGICVNSICDCSPGHFGADCSVQAGTIPTVHQVYNSGLCDIDNQRCSRIKIAATPITSEVICRWQNIDRDTANFYSEFLYTNSSIITSEKVFCAVPQILFKSLRHFHLSIAVDGITYSQDSYVSIYSSQCVSCISAKRCQIKPNTCLVDGRCYTGTVCQNTTLNNSTSSPTVETLKFEKDIGIIAAVTTVSMVALAIIAVVSVMCIKKKNMMPKRSQSNISVASTKSVTGLYEIQQPTSAASTKADALLVLAQQNMSSEAPMRATYDFNRRL